MNAEERLYEIITEELSRSDVNSMIASKLDSNLSSNDFKKKVKEIAASVVEELFKTLWQKKTFWATDIKK